MLRLFPNVQARGLPIKLFHYDEIAGRVQKVVTCRKLLQISVRNGMDLAVTSL